eukprot:7673995-Pyramimonas_sp.AAC.1
MRSEAPPVVIIPKTTPCSSAHLPLDSCLSAVLGPVAPSSGVHSGGVASPRSRGCSLQAHAASKSAANSRGA